MANAVAAVGCRAFFQKDEFSAEELEVEAARCEAILASNKSNNRQSQVQLEFSQVRKER